VRLRLAILALAATLPLAGCGGGRPEPSLHSNDARERLQAARNAHDRFGAYKPRAVAADTAAIVGRWDHPWGIAHLHLRSDGTFTEVALLGTNRGTYRLLSRGEIEFNSPGTFYGRNVVKFPYRLSGDALEVNVCDDWVKYTKAK
jgi:hypothetical protein